MFILYLSTQTTPTVYLAHTVHHFLLASLSLQNGEPAASTQAQGFLTSKQPLRANTMINLWYK